MVKRFFESFSAVCLGVSLVLIFTVFFAVYVFAGGDQGGETPELTVELVPPEVYEYTSIYSMFEYEKDVKYNTATEGTLELKTSKSRYKNSMTGALTLRNLEYLDQYDEIYEAWLVDLDTGFQQSQGLFLVDQDGYVRFSFQSSHYASPYEMIVVTKEEYPDDDPRPNGEVVLVGYFDTTSLTRSTVSSARVTRYEYKQYGEEADSVYE